MLQEVGKLKINILYNTLQVLSWVSSFKNSDTISKKQKKAIDKIIKILYDLGNEIRNI